MSSVGGVLAQLAGGLGSAAGFLVAAVAIVSTRGGSRAWLGDLAAAVCVGGAVSLGLVWLRNWRLDRIAARRACLTCGICAGCGYRLTAIPTQPDGCTACPECGAAWRLPSD